MVPLRSVLYYISRFSFTVTAAVCGIQEETPASHHPLPPSCLVAMSCTFLDSWINMYREDWRVVSRGNDDNERPWWQWLVVAHVKNE